jgi:anti-sigma factor RsiW
MDCTRAKDAIVDTLTARTADSADVAAHLVTCDECARFASRQRALDARLTSVLAPPALSGSFRSTLRQRMRRERRRAWLDAAPDIVHFVSCGAATAVAAALAPANMAMIVSLGAAAALAAYVALATLRSSLEDAD